MECIYPYMQTWLFYILPIFETWELFSISVDKYLNKLDFYQAHLSPIVVV